MQLLAGLTEKVITATGTPAWTQTLSGRSLRLEASLLLGVSEQQAERLLDSAATLCTSYPALLTQVASGAVSVRNARVVTEASVVLHTGDLARDRVVPAAYEEAMIEYAVKETLNRLRPIAERYATQYSEAVLLGRDEVRANIIRDLILTGVIPTAPATGHGVTGVVQVILQGTELGIDETDIHGSNIDEAPPPTAQGSTQAVRQTQTRAQPQTERSSRPRSFRARQHA